MNLPASLRELLSPALTPEELEAWLMAPAGPCPGCEETMRRWEALNGACQCCEPLPYNPHGCSCSMDRSSEYGLSGWHVRDDGAHGTVFTRCSAYWNGKTLEVEGKAYRCFVDQKNPIKLQVVLIEDKRKKSDSGEGALEE